MRSSLSANRTWPGPRRHRLAPRDRLVTIPNGLDIGPGGDPPPASDIERKIGAGSGGPVVGTVARLHRQKGIGHLLRAAPKIFAAVPGARIVVVGEGPLGRELRRRAAAPGLEGRFVFLGENEDARRLISLFDIFVLPSLWEGLPFVLVEAAALGKPIVATAVDGVPEIIDIGKTGILVPPGDAEALANAVISLLSDKPRAAAMAAAARR